jgi:hypothetical protein
VAYFGNLARATAPLNPQVIKTVDLSAILALIIKMGERERHDHG